MAPPHLEPGVPLDVQVRRKAGELIALSIAASSASTYASAHKHWVRWRVDRGRPLHLSGRDPQADEDELIDFVAYKGGLWNYAHSSVRVMLYAVRRDHLLNRRGNPLADRPLLALALKGLKRLQGGPRRKIPASMELLRLAIARLDLEAWDGLVKATALIFMFVFLLRSREALRKGAEPDQEQCVRVFMILMAKDGEEVTGDAVQAADEVVLTLGKSKADQDGQGSVANAYVVEGEELCLVGLLKKMHAKRPEHFAKGGNFLFTLDSGKVLHRDEVVRMLREPAAELGLPEEALGVISMRSGGATAMWNVGATVAQIQRRGRWATDCWRVYVWEGRERARDLVGKMLSSSFSLMASLAHYKRSA